MSKKSDERLKELGCWFTFVSHDAEQRDKLKEEVKEFPFWGYIDHKPDKGNDEEEKHFHSHYIIYTRGGRTILQLSKNNLSIPSNFIQKVRGRRGLMRYFIHLDNPEKVQYSEADIVTNDILKFKEAWTDNQFSDIKALYKDIERFRLGELSFADFIDLHYMEFSKMPFYQKVKTYEYLSKIGRALT